MKWPRRRRDEPDLTRAWRDIDYAVVDLETTGLDLHRDSIASYGVVLVEGGRILPRDTYGLVRPSSPMTPEAILLASLDNLDAKTTIALPDSAKAPCTGSIRLVAASGAAGAVSRPLSRPAFPPLSVV